MPIENAGAEWVCEEPQDGVHYRRVRFCLTELRDFGRDVGIVVENDSGRLLMVLSRYEMQKLLKDISPYWLNSING